MSLRKNWILKEYDADAAELISEALSISRQTAALLVQRGYDTKRSALDFINKESAVMHDPFLLPDMDKAVKRIEQAAAKGQKIMIYGDYDVDGITGTSVLVMFFRSIGCEVYYHIPSRFTEGYGVNEEAIRSFKNQNIDLIITVDTGITADREAAIASDLGMDMIITDHHECRPTLPDALAVINPKRSDSKYPFKELAGVGVAFKLICAYSCYSATGQTYFDREERELIYDVIHDCYKKYGEIVALGTIADIMPVIDENRLIVAYGLMRMPKTRNVGLRALLKAADISDLDNKKKINTSTVGFTLAPRINAAGRLGDASRAVELFLTKSESEADEIAQELCEKNKERQGEENAISKEAEQMISDRVDLRKDRIIILDSPSWHHGVIGIVSSRITEKYRLPSILISFEGCDGEGKGSGRSIEAFNLIEALTECSGYLTKFGGHALAAGLSVKRSELDGFRSALTKLANERISEKDTEPKAYADLRLYPGDLTLELMDDLSKLEPFGASNPVPLFMMKDLKIKEILPLSGGKHLRLNFECENTAVQAMYFGKSEQELPFIVGDSVDILFNLNENEFRSVVSLQIVIRDMRLSEESALSYEADEDVYGYIKDDFILPQKDHIPDRRECALIFRAIKNNCKDADSCVLNLNRLLHYEVKDIGYIKARLILDVFEELGFIEQYTEDGLIYRIKLETGVEKKDLFDSPLFARLNSVEG